MMRAYKSKSLFLLVLFIASLLLGGCSQFTGLRKPLYDGTEVEVNEAAMAIYQETNEVVGAEKDYYIRYPFSESIYEASLDYPNELPILIEEGVYTVGVDLPVGRATLLGNESVFTSENNVVHVGNMIVRDATGAVYFENLFHSSYGQLVTQVDLIAGHTIEVKGRNPEITVFYSETLPDNPYILMDPPELLVNLDRLQIIQPLVSDMEQETVQLTAGIFEVGMHIEPGDYEITRVVAPHATELYIFTEDKQVRVIELLLNENLLAEDSRELVEEHHTEDEIGPVIELKAGDKIYPNLVSQLHLKKISPSI